MNQKAFAAIVLSVAALLSVPAPAMAGLVFSFSFDNDPAVGGVAGTVSGRIFGLVDNQANQQATTIIIDSHPAGMPGVIEQGLIVTDWPDILANSFDVTGAVITAATFESFVGSSGSNVDVFCLNRGGGCIAPAAGLRNGLTFDGTSLIGAVANNGGFSGVTYSAVPEPGAAVLLFSGVALLGSRRRRRAGG